MCRQCSGTLINKQTVFQFAAFAKWARHEKGRTSMALLVNSTTEVSHGLLSTQIRQLLSIVRVVVRNRLQKCGQDAGSSLTGCWETRLHSSKGPKPVVMGDRHRWQFRRRGMRRAGRCYQELPDRVWFLPQLRRKMSLNRNDTQSNECPKQGFSASDQNKRI